LNILEKYPDATAEQKYKLLAAQSEWEKEIEARGDPPYTKGRLDAGKTDYYADVTAKYKKAIQQIMADPSA